MRIEDKLPNKKSPAGEPDETILIVKSYKLEKADSNSFWEIMHQILNPAELKFDASVHHHELNVRHTIQKHHKFNALLSGKSTHSPAPSFSSPQISASPIGSTAFRRSIVRPGLSSLRCSLSQIRL